MPDPEPELVLDPEPLLIPELPFDPEPPPVLDPTPDPELAELLEPPDEPPFASPVDGLEDESQATTVRIKTCSVERCRRRMVSRIVMGPFN